MVVAFMQVLDTSVTNVVLPHLQGSLSAGLEEVSWVLTSYLAANAVIIPATGWLAGLLGRKRFFLICAALFTVSSFLSGIAPNLTFLIIARIFQGIGGGPIIPLSQAILWEIFPLGQRGLAMAVWGIGFMMGPIIGPTLGGYIADNWSWRWIFYINLPVGFLGFFMASAFLFDPPYLRKPGRIDWPGLTLMVLGFGCLQLLLDRGEREDWFDSTLIVTLAVLASGALVSFVIRELMAREPILDLRVFADRNFATGATFIAFIMISVFLFDAPFHRKPSRVDVPGIALMVLGFGCLQLMLDLGEREEWFDSAAIIAFMILAVVAITAFVLRELTTDEPILDVKVFGDRNFGVGSMCIFIIALGFNSSLLLVALYTQKILGYDAWTSGLTLAPGGLGTMMALMISGRLVARMDQRLMLVFGCVLQAVSLWMMTHVTLSMDYWALAAPRFVQGFSQGFIFVPLQALALSTIRTERLGNATAAFSVVRNVGGSIGVAMATTFLARRSQQHQSYLVSHVNPWNPEMNERLSAWTDHFLAHGADSFTAARRAMAMLYRETVTQAQVLSYADDFWFLLYSYALVLLLIPFMQRVRADQARRARTTQDRPEQVARDPGLPAPSD